ncbi:amidohydrolase family protein [Nonomuraea sp. SYSU D8015]|uniref:amidohydrolase family protein n=1 Tax=Nonomuraea sp. SYSU D8015 TaxID=2593644 RepID=UPI001CB6F142|nr:amidohydrolase family protein [Nonomuraea sp. SYSU D8015]
MTDFEPPMVDRREFGRWLLLGAAGLTLAGGVLGADPAAAGSAGVVVLAGATVIDGVRGTPLTDAVVVLAGDRIVWVGRRREAVMPEGARLVDVRGKFVIPGLWDAHTHMTSSAEAVYPPLHLANGVTGIREMWGAPALHALRQRIESGQVLGPRIIMSGDIIDGPNSVWAGDNAIQVSTEAEARAAAHATKDMGADFVKTYSYMGRDTLAAVIDESRRLGMPVVGHVPWRMSIAEAADLGLRSFEHLFGMPTAVSSREDDIRHILATTPIDPARPRQYYDLARELDRQASLSYDPAKAEALFGHLVRRGAWQSPTLTVLRAVGSPAGTYANDPRLKYVPADVRAFWSRRILELAPGTPEQIAEQRAYLDFRLRMVKDMHDYGVGILAGTDTPNPYTFPGFGAHDELELLVQAGLSPIQALRCMTSEVARFLGLQDRVGAVAPGRAADLVVLDADPLRDIRNTRRINTVVARGRLFPRRELDAMLAAVESAASGTEAVTARSPRICC